MRIVVYLLILNYVFCEYKQDFYVQVKNEPCLKYTIVMHLISWIHSRDSETKPNMESALSFIFILTTTLYRWTHGKQMLIATNHITLKTRNTSKSHLALKKSPLYSLPLELNELDGNRFQSNKATFCNAIKGKLLEEIPI